MDPILGPFHQYAAKMDYQKTSIPLISNLNGKAITELTPEYWRNHIRQPVCYQQGFNKLLEMGCTTFMEIGPQPILLNMSKRSCENAADFQWLASLSGKKDPETFYQSLEKIYHPFAQKLFTSEH